jgi:hypothetical protein
VGNAGERWKPGVLYKPTIALVTATSSTPLSCIPLIHNTPTHTQPSSLLLPRCLQGYIMATYTLFKVAVVVLGLVVIVHGMSLCVL